MNVGLVVKKTLNMGKTEVFEVEVALEDNNRSYARKLIFCFYQSQT